MLKCFHGAVSLINVTNSPLFTFNAEATSVVLALDNANGMTCLVPVVGKLGAKVRSGGAVQPLTIEQCGPAFGD